MHIAWKRIKTLLIWIGLFIMSILILLFFCLPAFIVGVVAKFWRTKIGKGLDEFAEDLKTLQ